MAETKEDMTAPTDVHSSIVTFKKRGAKASVNIRKRPPTPAPSQSDDSSGYSSFESKYGHRSKERKKNAGVVTASSASNKSADRELPGTIVAADCRVLSAHKNDATKQSNWFDENSKDAPLLKSSPEKSQIPDGTYKGLANQTSFILRNPDAPTRPVGPVKAPTNIRTTTTTDFAPDVCKDFKKTGFCGFGQNCVFLHDRSDYKQGWELYREWENVTKGKRFGGTVVANANRSKMEEENDDGDTMSEAIPFACIICKGPYREPVVTRCGHYFCESCALGIYRKDPSCAACGLETNGVFSSAKRLKKLQNKSRE